VNSGCASSSGSILKASSTSIVRLLRQSTSDENRKAGKGGDTPSAIRFSSSRPQWAAFLLGSIIAFVRLIVNGGGRLRMYVLSHEEKFSTCGAQNAPTRDSRIRNHDNAVGTIIGAAVLTVVFAGRSFTWAVSFPLPATR
jgi:hypothetical protein